MCAQLPQKHECNLVIQKLWSNNFCYSDKIYVFKILCVSLSVYVCMCCVCMCLCHLKELKLLQGYLLFKPFNHPKIKHIL